MTRFYFEVEDEEVVKFVKALKRKRSAVITKLIRQLMEECDEYLPSWLLMETGCTNKVAPKRDTKRTHSFEHTYEDKKEIVKEKKPRDDNADVALAGLSGFGF